MVYTCELSAHFIPNKNIHHDWRGGGVPYRHLAPVAETGFSHRLTPYKIVGHFFGRSYLYLSQTNHVENSVF